MAQTGSSGVFKVGYLLMKGGVMLLNGSGAPTDGASGTGVGKAGPGSIYVRIGNGTMYQNTGTKALPVWTLIGTVGAGSVTQAMIVAAALDGTVAKIVADANPIGGIPVVFRITAAALTGDVDVVMTHKVRVIDAYCINTAAGAAADTITVKNGATAITDAMDINKADKVITRAGTIDDAAYEIAAAGTLRISGASGATCEVVVTAIRVA